MSTASETLSFPLHGTEAVEVIRATENTYRVAREYEHAHLPLSQYSVQGTWFRTTVRAGQGLFLVTAWETPKTSSRSGSTSTGHVSAYVIPHRSEAERTLRSELASYAELADNWDGQGAITPPQTAIRDALAFLDRRPEDIPLPCPEEGSEGEVGVYWDYEDTGIFAEVTFEGDGTYAYFAVRGTPNDVSDKCGEEGLEVAGPWPADLVRILRVRNSA